MVPFGSLQGHEQSALPQEQPKKSRWFPCGKVAPLTGMTTVSSSQLNLHHRNSGCSDPPSHRRRIQQRAHTPKRLRYCASRSNESFNRPGSHRVRLRPICNWPEHLAKDKRPLTKWLKRWDRLQIKEGAKRNEQPRSMHLLNARARQAPQRNNKRSTGRDRGRPTARRPTRLVPCPAPPPPQCDGVGGRHGASDGWGAGGEGGTDCTAPKDGDATPEGERPQRPYGKSRSQKPAYSYRELCRFPKVWDAPQGPSGDPSVPEKPGISETMTGVWCLLTAKKPAYLGSWGPQKRRTAAELCHSHPINPRSTNRDGERRCIQTTGWCTALDKISNCTNPWIFQFIIPQIRPTT